MMKQKKGFLARDWVVATILFAGIIALFALGVAGIASNYGRNDMINEDFQSRYNQMVDITNAKNKMFNSVTSGNGLSFQGTFDVAFGATFTVIQLVFSSITSYEMVVFNFIEDFTFIDANILMILFNVATVAITVILIFVWLSSISRGRF